MTKHRKGFTLVEVMIAVAIIVILLGIFFGSFKYIQAQQNEKSTRATLENLSGMYTELRVVRASAKSPLYNWGGTQIDLETSPYNDKDAQGRSIYQLNFWTVPMRTPFAGPPTGEPTPLANPGDVREESTTRFTTDAAVNTRAALQFMLRVPGIKKMYESMSADQLLAAPGDGPAYIKDRWNNPIIFVNGSGLAGVVLGGTARVIQRTDGTPFFCLCRCGRELRDG